MFPALTSIQHPSYNAKLVHTSKHLDRNGRDAATALFYCADNQPPPDHTLDEGLCSKNQPLAIALDAEWFVRNVCKPVKVKPLLPGVKFEGETGPAALSLRKVEERIVLSQQFTFRLGGVRYDMLFIPHNNLRFSLNVPLRHIVEFARAYSKPLFENLSGCSDKKKRKKSATPKIPALSINLIGHYGIVDHSTNYRKNNQSGVMKQTIGVRRTLLTLDPVKVNLYDNSNNHFATAITNFRDTMLLAPAGAQSLEKIGDTLGIPKIDFEATEHRKDRMDLLMKNDPNLFAAYSLTDTVVTLAWIERCFGVNVPIPMTIGGIGAREARGLIMDKHDWDIEQFDLKWRGLVTTKEPKPPGAKKQWQPLIKHTPSFEAVDAINKATFAYHGGRNECFAVGIHRGPWTDYDVAGAYATAMAVIPDPDFSLHPTYLQGQLSLATISPVAYGFGVIDFEFPEGTMYPCLPVKDETGKGLIYPRTGRTHAASPEVYLALRMGAKVTTHQFVVQPSTAHHSLAEVMAGMTRQRQQEAHAHGKGSPQELMAKEIINSVYGKVGQGLKGKRNYGIINDAYEDSPPSSITAAPQAALITSLVRALVSAALVQLGEGGHRVLSVTTDGFLTDADFEYLDCLDLFGFSDIFRAARTIIAGNNIIWEPKHACQTAVMFKTRGGVGIGEVNSAKLPIARAGYKFSLADTVAHRDGDANEYEDMAALYLDRDGSLPMSYTKLPGIVDYFRGNADGIATTVLKNLSLEYDFKREPQDPTEEQIEIDDVEYTHISYFTRPWENIDEFTAARAALGNNTIKTILDLEACDLRKAAAPVSIRTTGGTDKTIARSILRLIRGGGLVGEGLTPKSRAAAVLPKVSAACDGVKLTADDWTRARPSIQGSTLPVSSMVSQLNALGLTATNIQNQLHLVTGIDAQKVGAVADNRYCAK
ncbi:MAG: hypothetical protein WBO07_06260 [Formosimonas sp.]